MTGIAIYNSQDVFSCSCSPPAAGDLWVMCLRPSQTFVLKVIPSRDLLCLFFFHIRYILLASGEIHLVVLEQYEYLCLIQLLICRGTLADMLNCAHRCNNPEIQ